MTAYARVLISFAVAGLVVAPRTSRAGESEDADRALFIKYCAACHGEDGKGGGVVGPALANRPPDLTRLARDAGGEFPLGRVIRAIDGRDHIRAHGSGDMPVWGEVFAADPFNDRLDVRIKVRRLAEHVRRIQEPGG
jgi:mono/diheme cytochrome c family protein